MKLNLFFAKDRKAAKGLVKGVDIALSLKSQF
jgi:hypothetical protein